MVVRPYEAKTIEEIHEWAGYMLDLYCFDKVRYHEHWKEYRDNIVREANVHILALDTTKKIDAFVEDCDKLVESGIRSGRIV